MLSRAVLLPLVAALAVVSSSPAAQARSPHQSIDDAIKDVQAQQEAAWNAHDSVAYSALFAQDADVVNVLGWWWKSREELQAKLGMAFKSVFAASQLHIEDVEVRRLTADFVVAHVSWTMTGARSPDGSGANVPEHGLQTQLLRRVNGSWKIEAFQNTKSVPERPFR